MPKDQPKRKQASQYDKIIRENLEVTLPVIIKDLLGLQIAASEELPDDIQHTKERKPDALKRVTDTAGCMYVLHVEFQVEDEKEMVYRMADYCIMLMRKYHLPVKQYIVFLKDIQPAMPVFLDTGNLQFKFTLIRIADASYKLFLKSGNPEVKMLAILASFGKEDKYSAVKSIVEEMQSFTAGNFAEYRYFKQLRIFVQLRINLEQQFEKAMESVTTFFKEENDYLYRRGETKGEVRGEIKGEIKGEEKKSYTVVKNILLKLDLSDEQVAGIAEVPVTYVAKVRQELMK